MICKEFDELTPKEKTEYIGKLVHCVQQNSFLFQHGKRIIQKGEADGLFDKVIINPSDNDTHRKESN